MRRSLGFRIVAAAPARSVIPRLRFPLGRDWRKGNASTAVFSSFVELRFNIASSLPAGSILTCKAEIVPDVFDELDRRIASFGSASSTTTLRGTTIPPGTAGLCVLEIPFSWPGNRSPRTLFLRYEIESASPAGLVVLQGLSSVIRFAPSSPVQIVNLNLVAAP